MFGPGVEAEVGAAKVLVVGAGGVGCELLKNLGESGFREITLVDLDTIDVSNLNRQFLFRREHVGQSKAKTAAAAIEKMMKGRCRVEAIVGNIKDARFDAAFFATFTVVLNALDNVEARRHVNRMCLAADVPMVESGSTGYLGQVSVVDPRRTECYDCLPKPVPKSYAVCTIRSTPEKPIHCVVWAKHLAELLFGPEDESNLLVDLDHADESGVSLRWDRKEDIVSFADRLAQRVFWDDVVSQREVAADTWKTRAPPEPIDVKALAKRVPAAEVATKVDLLEQRVWSDEETASILYRTIQRIAETRAEEIGSLSFDKDDDDLLTFVTATANLRAKAFGVERSSAFAVKGMAGNIIHAVATTNAIVAALVVIETLKIVTEEKRGDGDGASLRDRCFTTYVQKFPSSGRRRRLLLQPEALQPPNKACDVCSKAQLRLEIDPNRQTLDFVVETILRGQLSMTEPCVFLTLGDHHNTLFESGDDLDTDELEMYEANAKKSLEELKVVQGAILEVTDFAAHRTASIHVNASADPEVPFLLHGVLPEPEVQEVETRQDKEEEEEVAVDSRKRRREEDDVVAVPSTKRRGSLNGDDVVFLDD